MEKGYMYKLKNIFINAFLLLIPSLIFIIVKVNTISNTVEWRLENILIFFILYVLMLSLFAFKPHVHLIRTKPVVYSAQKTKAIVDLVWGSRIGKIACLVLMLVMPWFLSLYQIKIFIYTFSFIIFAMGLNYTVGYVGLLNLGHVLPFAAGGYAYGLLYKYFQLGFLPSLVVGALAGLLVGALISLITIKLNGDYLAIVTLALAEIFRILVINLDSITEGARGISGIPLPTFFGIATGFSQKYVMLYYVCFLFVVGGIVLASKLIKSKFGRSWEANREDSIAAEAMGINIKSMRVLVFALGGCYAGISGVFLASNSTYISPSIVVILYSITVLSIIVLGGKGSIPGILLGAVIIVFLPEYLRAFELYRMLIYGVLLVIMMRYKPNGLIPQKRIKYFASTDTSSRETGK